MQYLSTKPNSLKDQFPKTYKMSTIIDFLIKNGYKQVDSRLFDNLYEATEFMTKECKSGTYPAFIVSKKYYNNDHKWIRFWKGPEITNDNPIFFIKATDEGTKPDSVASTDFATEDKEGRVKDIDNFDDFIKEIKNKNIFNSH